jgi:nucleotide-binding universal stress UspA family protein
MASHAPTRELGLQSVLVASDFSDASAKPLRHAVSIARHFHAKFYLAHVVSSIGFTIAGADALEAASTAAQRDVEKLEKTLVESGALTGLSHEFIVREGHGVWEELRALIREKQVELVVIGTHGRHGIEKLVLGSVAEQVFREADALVLTVGPHSLPDAPIESADGVRSILFPTDFGEASSHALPRAISFSNHFGARLVLLHVAPVMPIPEGFSWSKTPDDITQMREDARQKALKRMHEFVAESAPLSVTPEFVVEFGKHGESILHVARSIKADLIILGLNHSKHGGAVSHLPETTAYKIVTEAHCSVLTVRN